MCSPMRFQSKRDAWVAMSPAPIRNSIRKTPPTPMPRVGWPERLACSYSISLSTPHRISRAGQKWANSDPRRWISRIPIVPSRNRTPIRISTTGPAIERCGGRGVIVGLATVHLTGWRNWWNGWNRRCGRNRTSRARQVRACCERRNVSFGGCTSLQQLDSANHQQNYRPGAAKVRHMHVLDQEQEADGEKHRRAHKFSRAAARTSAARTTSRQEAPVAGEQPAAKSDQNEWPEAIDAVFHQAQRV